MSGNQETRIRPSSWQCSDINAGVPIKKRRYFVQPSSPPIEEASSTPSEIGSQPNEQGGSSIARNVPCSLDVKEKMSPQEKGGGSCVTITEADQKIIDQPDTYIEKPIPPVQSVSMGNAEKIEKDVEAKASDILVNSLETEMKLANAESIVQGKVKTEEPNLLVRSISLVGIGQKEKLLKASSPNILGSSVQPFALAKSANKERLVEAESPSAVVSSEKTEMKLTQPFLIMHDMTEKTCDKNNVQEECQTKVSSGSGISELPIGCRTGDSHQHQENEEPLSLNLSLSKGDCIAHNTDDISIGKSAGVDNGFNRSNWDLNTIMDNWEDTLEGTSIGEANLALLSNNSSPHDIKASSSLDKTAIASSFSEEQQKENVGFRTDVVTSVQSDHLDNPGCSLSLGLSSYQLIEKSPCLSASINEAGARYMCLSKLMMTTENANSANLRIVKSEPLDEIVRQGAGAANDCPMGLLNNTVKRELVERSSKEASSSSGCFLKSVDPTSVKAEPKKRVRSEIVTRKDGTLNQPDKLMIQSNKIEDLPTCLMSNKDKQIPYSIGSGRVSTPLADMTINPCDLNYSECRVHENSAQSSSAAYGKSCETLMHAEAEPISSCLGHDNNNLNASGVTIASLTENTIDDLKTCRLKELPPDSRGTGESSLSDEEKINLSGDLLEEDMYGSDFESDGGHDLSKVKKTQDRRINEYEDGEVQGSAAGVAEENSTTKKSEVGHANCVGSGTENAGLDGVDFQNSTHFEGKGSGSAGRGKTSNDHIKECTGASLDNKLRKCTDDDSCLLETVEMPSSEVEIKRLIPELQRRPHNGSGEKEAEIIQDQDHSSYRVVHMSEGTSGASTVSSGNVQNPEIVEKSSSASYKAEISTGDDDPPKEIIGGGNHSRIISLAQVSSKSPVKKLDAPDSFMQSQMGRERLPDLPLEAGKFLPRGRDEAFIDDSYKFSRERYHGQFIRNPRTNFMPDRRRFSDRTESSLRDRDSESKHVSKFFGGGREFPVSRIKYDSDLMDADFEFNNFGNTRQDGAFVRSFRRGRRPASDETTFFSHSFSRRRSPGYSFTHRGPRNSEDGSAFHGHRDGDKFMRGLQRNNLDPMFGRPQRSYEDFDGRIVRGQKNFSPIHKRGLPRFRSRSPARSRARSPGPCSSFRSRSPDGFGGRPDSPRRRSPPGYRMERMRSPDHSVFPRDMVIRRHGSPPYSSRPSNALRDMGPGRGRGYRRSGISFRNPSDRVIPRHRGKFNILDSRERVEYGDDFFEGPMHSDRFGEFGVDGNTERRRFGDRHDTIRSFRPSFNTDDCAPSNVGTDPNAMRFGQEDDAEIEEQDNLREFDRRNKSQTGDAPRRARTSEEKEESSRQGGEIWHGDEFDDERAKKKGY